MTASPHARPPAPPAAARLRRMRGAVAVLAVCLAVLAGCGRAAAAGSPRSSDVPGTHTSQPGSARAASTSASPGASVAAGGSAGSAGSASALGGAAGGSAGPSGNAAAAPSGSAAPDTTAAGSGGAAGSATTATLQIVVIGDSLTSGRATPGYPWTTPAQQILDRADLPAHIVNSSVSGIGYDNDGGVGITFQDLVAKVVTDRTDIVVLFGSDNDSPGKDLDAAVQDTVDQAQKQAPNAAVVVVGPPVTPAQKGADLSGIDDALQAAAQRSGATFVDASDWFEGKSAQLLSSDGEHPNDAGEDYLGQKFADLLEPLIRARLGRG